MPLAEALRLRRLFAEAYAAAGGRESPHGGQPAVDVRLYDGVVSVTFDGAAVWDRDHDGSTAGLEAALRRAALDGAALSRSWW